MQAYCLAVINLPFLLYRYFNYLVISLGLKVSPSSADYVSARDCIVLNSNLNEKHDEPLLKVSNVFRVLSIKEDCCAHLEFA